MRMINKKTASCFFLSMFLLFSVFTVSAKENDECINNNLAYIEIILGDEYCGRQYEIKTKGQKNTGVVTAQDGGRLMLEISSGNRYVVSEKDIVSETVVLTTAQDENMNSDDFSSENIENSAHEIAVNNETSNNNISSKMFLLGGLISVSYLIFSGVKNNKKLIEKVKKENIKTAEKSD